MRRPTWTPGDVAPLSLVTDEDRKHWAFRKPKRSRPPQVKAAHRVRSPVDAFVLGRLEASRLGFADDAEKSALLRRASLDLLGLPPSPQCCSRSSPMIAPGRLPG
ncbi:MAG: hypothetical protein Ct9H300mP1_02180 [Planctomycetaceae bacterium]|nr:MAG: hypothetical protein Ct9H300mP1_02180 [Planctomycetaceae bacterium]